MTDHIMETKISKGASRDKFTCALCKKKFKNNTTKRAHLRDCHDNKEERVLPLKCIHSSCTSSFQSRQKFIKHIDKCTRGTPIPSASVTSAASTAPSINNLIDNEDKDMDDDAGTQDENDTATETWAGVMGEEEAIHDNQDNSGKTFDALREQLITTTGNINTADFLLKLTEPITINLKDGSTENVLALPGGARRLMQNTPVSVQQVKRKNPKGNGILDSELRPALAAHAFGGLVSDESDYIPLNEDLCHRSFRKDGKDIAKRLAGALIQSGSAVLLALKVEVYGRSPSEDPHQQDLAYPISGAFVVQALFHDGATKILIGTQTWNALITSAVILTRGVVVVGPNNKEFYPCPDSKVWVLKYSCHNTTIERQTRSKFDDLITMEPYAGIFVLFHAHKFLPVTLKTLWDYIMGRKWSGIKLVAFIFYQLHHTQRLEKIDIEFTLQKVESANKSTQSDTKILGDVKDLVLAFEEKDKICIPVSAKVSNCLRILAGHTTNVITNLNQEVVAREIEKHIQSILADRGF
ncbi:hypothetical protein BGW38_010399 [Lunasporangiospora selenospora]|uniref:C2H2-type domain-containing protein n=1 Tax=Lunasporangiospora selenospora TaxID=979761 RepID=A0A9P6FX53_9FUNG|nr:hypothetical protein BGW38_010399 [Lunasporangiospora selenospora]